MNVPSLDNEYQVAHVRLLATSYHRWTGRWLCGIDTNNTTPLQVAQQLFDAAQVVVSHGVQSDPIFNYGNRAALSVFDMNWVDFTNLPSRKSAEPVNREERARLLDRVTKHQYIDDYAGVRISSAGRRFFIPRATVWNLVDSQGNYRGQAATFSNWDFLEGPPAISGPSGPD